MGLDRLDAPLRMTWTAKAGCRSEEQLLLLGDRVAEAGLFYLTLQGDFQQLPRLAELLDRLVAAGIQVSLVADPAMPMDRLSGTLPLQQLTLDCTTLCAGTPHWEGRLSEVVQDARKRGFDPALQLIPLKDTVAHLARLVSVAADLGVKKLILPNTPLVEMKEADQLGQILRAEDILAFGRSWEQEPPMSRPNELVVHDLFLWEILSPEQGRENYSGCQAGNSLAHLASSGMLYPCSAWDEPLGDPLEQSIRSLWNSEGRTDVLEQIEDVPSGCDQCADWPCCFGGCRGLSRAYGQHNQGRDLLCPGCR